MKVIETRNEITNPVFEIEKTKDDSNNNDIIVVCYCLLETLFVT